jgi:hypothetical protein
VAERYDTATLVGHLRDEARKDRECGWPNKAAKKEQAADLLAAPKSLLRATLKPGERLVCYCPPGVCQAPTGFSGPCNRAPTAGVTTEARNVTAAEDRMLRNAARASATKVADGRLVPAPGVPVTAAPLPFSEWPKLATDAYDALERHLMNGPSFPLGLLYQLRVGIAGRLVDGTPGVGTPDGGQHG